MKAIYWIYDAFGLCFLLGHWWEPWWTLPKSGKIARSCRACTTTELSLPERELG